MKYVSSMALGLMAFAAPAFAQAPSTAPSSSPADAPLRIVLDAVEGTVLTRNSPDQAWQPGKVGAELAEGSEIRTGVRSAARLAILPDQLITIDRLTTLQILRANLTGGTIVTDLGMKYGRTRYDINAEGRPHDAKVHSPSAVLAIRGTDVILYDQPPFAPQAVSLFGRAQFRDAKKQVGFGGTQYTQISEDDDSAADHAKRNAVNEARGKFAGRTETDNLLQLSLAAYGGSDFSNLGVLAFLDQARAGDFKGSLVGALPIGRQLSFTLVWTGSPGSDVDLSIISPRGETVSPLNLSVPTSGRHLGNNVADEGGFGSEQVVWEISYPPGSYTVRAQLQSGATADAQIFTIDDPLGSGQLISTITGTLNSNSPTLQGTVRATGKDQNLSSSSSVKKPKSTRKR